MQSGYGGVSEIQQFMVDNCGSSLFSISSAPANPSAASAAATDIQAAAPQPLKYHPFPHPHHPHPHHHHHQAHQPPPPPPPQQPPAAVVMPPHFSHFHPITPITQQLFHQPPHHQFQLFHPEQRRLVPQHHLRLDQDSGPDTPTSPARIMAGGGSGGGAGSSFLASAMSFKLAVKESSGGGSREGIEDDGGGSILQGDDGSESRLHHHWQREEESAIKEPTWRPLDIDYINDNNKRCKEKGPESSTTKYCKKTIDGAADSDRGHTTSGSNYKPFSELEAIYKPGGGSTSFGGGGSGGGGPNQTGSGSALTGEETPIPPTAAAAAAPGAAVDHHAVVGGSETSAGEDQAPAKKFSSGSGRRRRRRRQQQQQQLSSIAAFIEGLLKQLMDHQEGLHRKFLEVMERREQERAGREEAWRRQEAAKSSREAAARAHERAVAAAREAAIVAFLEKITGESLQLPTKPQLPEVDSHNEDETTDNLAAVQPTSDAGVNGGDSSNNTNVQFSTSRWPRVEVEALIGVRSGLESRFQEPGLKGPLWEEVSARMAAMGFQRSAKRCKEKWENINKYFRKAKESGKKRPQHSKTCPYFHQLDQLYSKSTLKANNHSPPPLPLPAPAPSSSILDANAAAGGAGASAASNDQQRKDNSELLDAIVVATDHDSFKFSHVGSLTFDFNTKGGERNEAASRAAIAGKAHAEVDSANDNDDDDDDDDEESDGDGGEEDDEGDGEEGEGESQGQEGLLHRRHRQLRQEQQQQQQQSREPTLFFQRLQS